MFKGLIKSSSAQDELKVLGEYHKNKRIRLRKLYSDKGEKGVSDMPDKDFDAWLLKEKKTNL